MITILVLLPCRIFLFFDYHTAFSSSAIFLLRTTLPAIAANCLRFPFLYVAFFLALLLSISFRPIKARSLAHGTALAERRLKMTVTERYGAGLFRMVNACVMLDESNRFSPTYAPIMERCLHSKCNPDDVKLLNSCVMGASATRNASTCFDASIITFRNKVHISFPVHSIYFFASVTLCSVPIAASSPAQQLSLPSPSPLFSFFTPLP